MRKKEKEQLEVILRKPRQIWSLSVDPGSVGAYTIWKGNVPKYICDYDISKSDDYYSTAISYIIKHLEYLVEKHKCKAIFIEKPSRRLAIAWLFYQDIRGIEFGKVFQDDVHPLQVKKLCTNDGRASKSKIRKWVVKNISLSKSYHTSVDGDNKMPGTVSIDDLSEHAIDSIAIGYAGMKKWGIL